MSDTDRLRDPAGFPGFAVTLQQVKMLVDSRSDMDFATPEKTVKFIIGTEKAIFVMHRDIAASASPVFKAAFDSNFIEGQTQTYTLEDIIKSTFQLLFHWVYRQKFPSFVTQPEIENNLKSNPNHLSKDLGDKIINLQMSLCELWVLADRLQMPRLQNSVIDELEHLRASCGILVFPISLHYVYKTLPKEAALRRLLFAEFSLLVSKQPIEKFANCFPQEMLLEYIVEEKRSGIQKRKNNEFGFGLPEPTTLECQDFYVPEPGGNGVSQAKVRRRTTERRKEAILADARITVEKSREARLRRTTGLFNHSPVVLWPISDDENFGDEDVL